MSAGWNLAVFLPVGGLILAAPSSQKGRSGGDSGPLMKLAARKREEQVIVEHGDTSRTRELRFALDAYLEARFIWKATLEELGPQLNKTIRTGDERELYRLARILVHQRYLEDVAPGVSDFGEVTDRARRYLTEVSRLSNVLEDLRQHLENISEGARDP